MEVSEKEKEKEISDKKRKVIKRRTDKEEGCRLNF